MQRNVGSRIFFNNKLEKKEIESIGWNEKHARSVAKSIKRKSSTRHLKGKNVKAKVNKSKWKKKQQDIICLSGITLSTENIHRDRNERQSTARFVNDNKTTTPLPSPSSKYANTAEEEKKEEAERSKQTKEINCTWSGNWWKNTQPKMSLISVMRIRFQFIN